MKVKSNAIIMVLLSIMLVLTGCGAAGVNHDNESKNEVSRIISTSPSNTEILVGLGLGDKLVAVDTYSTDIEGLKSDLTQLALDKPDAEAILALKPDLIVTSEINQVGNVENPFKTLEESGIKVIYIPTSTSLEGIYGDIQKIADATGTQEAATIMIDQMKAEVDRISKIAATIPDADRKNVYFEISPAPSLYSFGKNTFLNEMIEIVGAKNIFADQDSWISASEEAVLKANPDVILTNVNYIENPIDEIKGRAGWENITAIKNNEVYSINTNAAARPSQNVITALNEMAKAIYPNYYA